MRVSGVEVGCDGVAGVECWIGKDAAVVVCPAENRRDVFVEAACAEEGRGCGGDECAVDGREKDVLWDGGGLVFVGENGGEEGGCGELSEAGEG